jgi:hypothetical protein
MAAAEVIARQKRIAVEQMFHPTPKVSFVFVRDRRSKQTAIQIPSNLPSMRVKCRFRLRFAPVRICQREQLFLLRPSKTFATPLCTSTNPKSPRSQAMLAKARLVIP